MPELYAFVILLITNAGSSRSLWGVKCSVTMPNWPRSLCRSMVRSQSAASKCQRFESTLVCEFAHRTALALHGAGDDGAHVAQVSQPAGRVGCGACRESIAAQRRAHYQLRHEGRTVHLHERSALPLPSSGHEDVDYLG